MYEKLAEFTAQHLELDIADITPDSTFESLGIDSLDVIEIVMELEDELGIELDLGGEQVTTFQDLANLIESKLN
jgi:acyl carrier protein